MSSFFAFVHHLAAFTLFSALVLEFALIKGELTVRNARTIQLADLVLGVSAGVVLVAGLLRVFYFEKGAPYYFHSITFIAKLSLFVAVALLSIYPTVQFLSWGPALKKGNAPVVDARTLRAIRAVVHFELVGVVLVILFAALMARGVGYAG